MTTLHADYETASRINLKTAGAHKYAADSSTRVLMLGWAIDDEPVNLWQPHLDPNPPRILVEALNDPHVKKEAFNAPFERLITHYRLGVSVPYEQWRCVMVKAYYLAFTGGLDDVCEQIGLPGKDKRGKDLINKFCKPAGKNHKVDWYDWRNAPDDWEAFCQYCIQDVITERLLSKWLDRFPQMPDWDWWQFALDQLINDRGVPLDVPFAERCITLWSHERERITDELKRTTGLTSVTPQPFKSYVDGLLYVNGCAPLSSLRGDYITSRLKNHHPSNGNPIPAPVESLIKTYQAKEAKAATKYSAVLSCVQSDGRARGMFQYKGASRTDRAGGRRLQLQNLKRPLVKEPEQIPDIKRAIVTADRERLKSEYKTDVAGALGASIRHVIQAPEGYTLVVTDLTSIESVVLGYAANCYSIDELFRAGRDSYKTFGVQYYGVAYDDVTKEQRGFCKPPVLGCGYMLGWKGLISYAEGMGVKMSEEQARKAVDTFRGMYPEIVNFWYTLYDCIKYTVRTGRKSHVTHFTIERDAEFLRIWLPSGRALSYFKPEIMDMPAPWDHSKTVENFTFMGKNDSTKNQWERISAHAGGITENIVQSMAGDILWHGIGNCHHAGLDVILHVHDEIGSQCPVAYAPRALEVQKECMTRRLPWAPGMWLGASGMITPSYTKD